MNGERVRKKAGVCMFGRNGFTLLEAMVVIMIAGILAALTIPSYQRMANRARLNGATRELISDLMRTRMQCVAENRQFEFQFGGDVYKILRDDDRSGVLDSTEVFNVREVGRVYAGVTVTAPGPITFTTRGMVTADTVTVTNAVGTKCVLINMVGRVHVIEG
jgi:prepilin-type N-terminal cleavage/methylation domain-containing protein